ncbi:hypothetical protein [Acetomicrobium sp. UBA5826]|uniref:hypothetical protein n=1 Tax=Acetomicrobium sp. UBA5826 TaxID=1946039 RepID=UPI00257ACA22|nr:hypothetical protein [Acetomicrobium sp. UBA5826]
MSCGEMLCQEALKGLNCYLANPESKLVRDIANVIKKYGSPCEINERACEARKVSNLLQRLSRINSPYLKDLEWLMEQKEKRAFVSISEFREKVLGEKAKTMQFDESTAPTLEISALQYFPWFISEAKRAIEKRELMPGRFIRVRNMKEQEQDKGDIMAVAAAAQIAGASWVETLDTKGTDGSNIHLGGPETITGYFTGVGQPNDHPVQWVDEYLYYATNYGVREVLNINPGSVLAGLILYRLGVDIKFKISVFMGTDNPYYLFIIFALAKLLAREDGSTALSGINLANSVNVKTFLDMARMRREMGLEDKVRIEHHITEAYKSIIIQPYCRREDLLIAVEQGIPNISAKHEGGDPEDEEKLDHPSDILDYFRAKAEVEEAGDLKKLEQNYIYKHIALNRTAEELTKRGFSFVAATGLHSR